MQEKKSINCVAYCQSWIVHLLFLVPTISIIILCIGKGYSFQTLHTALSTVGYGLLMTEAVLVVSGEAVLVAKVSRQYRIKIHWLLNGLGLALVMAGFVAIAFADNKQNGNATQSTSVHGRVCRIGTVVGLLVCLTAIPTVKTGILPKKMNLHYVKLFHICIGIISTILLLAGQITGLYESWWSSSELGRELCYASYVIGAFFLLIRPLYSWGTKIFSISQQLQE